MSPETDRPRETEKNTQMNEQKNEQANGPEGRPQSGLESGPERGAALTPAQRAARRRRLAEVFGDAVPEQTSDDTDEPTVRADDGDEWLRRQVPPHHG